MSAPERCAEESSGWGESAAGAAPAGDRTRDGAVGDARPRPAALARAGRRLRRVFRVFRVGLCFSYFGVGGWLVATFGLPLLRLDARWRRLPAEDRELRVQRLVHLGCRSFVACITTAMRLGRVRVAGAEALRRGPVLVVANHPSLIDTPLLATQLAQADFIVSPGWTRIGWMRQLIAAAGYLHADAGADVVQQAAARLRAGRSVVVYPEGSRTPPEGLRRFQRGAAHIALEAGCDLLPVTLRVTPRVLMRGERWTAYPSEDPVWEIEVGQPIHPADHLDGSEGRPLAARRLTGILEGHFQKGWELGRR